MSHSFHQLYYHFIWATHQRLPLISRKWRARLLEILHEEVIHRGGKPIRHNAMPDHVHLLYLQGIGRIYELAEQP